MAETAVLVLLLSLLKKLVDFTRQLRAGKEGVNAVVTQLASWLGGVLLVFIVAQSAFAGGLDFAGVTLSGAGFWTQVLIGLAVASTASVGNDVLAAVDNSRTSKVPPLVPTPEAEAKP